MNFAIGNCITYLGPLITGQKNECKVFYTECIFNSMVVVHGSQKMNARSFIQSVSLIVWLLSMVAIGTRPPSIYIQPDYDIYYEVGETVQMPCVAKGHPQPKYRWQKNKKDFVVSGNDRIKQLPNVGTIVINRPEDKDEGIYQCFADNGYGVSATININLRLAKLERFPNKAGIKHYPRLGDRLTLNCVIPDSAPSAKFYWAILDRHSGFVAINYTARVTVDHEARLRFVNVIPEDANEGRAYACVAMNSHVRSVEHGYPSIITPRGSTAVLHVVQYLWASPSDHYGLRGDEFKLKCIFSGNPTPDVHWARIGGELPKGVKVESYGQELVFSSLEESDAGEYECLATNMLSPRRGSRIFKVSVKSRPYWRNQPKDVEIKEGSTARFTCDADGDPKPSVKWFVNSIPIALNKDPRLQKFRVVQADTVEILNVTRVDAMVIQCNVTNKHGYLWSDSYLNVLYKDPVIG